MKKLSKLTLKNAENLMDENEMKNVVGGYGYAGTCTPPESVYKCIPSWTDGPYGSVTVCALNPSDAARKLKEEREKLTGNSVDINSIVCGQF